MSNKRKIVLMWISGITAMVQIGLFTLDAIAFNHVNYIVLSQFILWLFVTAFFAFKIK